MMMVLSLKMLLWLPPIDEAVLCFSSAPTEAPANVEGKALSATEALVWWLTPSQSNMDYYQVRRNPS